MKVQHLVFDWDGTLADTYPVISAAYEYAFKTLGLPAIPYDEIKRLTSTLQNKDTLGFIFGEQKEQAKEAYYNYIGLHHATELQAMTGAAELLGFCHQKGLSSYLITNKKRLYFLEECNQLGFTPFFTNIVTAGDFAEDKPHPLATHALFGKTLPEADTIMVIGDGLADYQVARTYDHNGKKALCTLYDPKGKYSGDRPDFLVDDLTKIIEILQS